MKQVIIMLLFVGCVDFIHAQELEGRVRSLEDRTKKIEDDYKQEIKSSRQDMASNTSATKALTAEVAKLGKLKIESDEARFKRCVNVLQNSSEFVKSAKKSFKSIDVSLTMVSFWDEITNLNNPTNNELGFSLKEIINQLIEKHITSKDKGLNSANRVNNFVNGILNNPLTDIVKSAVPVINTVVSFISNISFGSKKIKEEDFNAFVKELQSYIRYYEGLANASSEFRQNLEQIKIRTKALEMILCNYLKDRILDLHKVDLEKEENNMDKLFNSYFTKDKITVQSEQVKKDNQGSFVDAVKDTRMSLSMTIETQARFIQDELEALSIQYVSANRKYLLKIIEVLNYSTTLVGSDKEKVAKKIASLNEQLEIWAKKFVDLVDINEVKSQVKNFNELLSLVRG